MANEVANNVVGAAVINNSIQYTREETNVTIANLIGADCISECYCCFKNWIKVQNAL